MNYSLFEKVNHEPVMSFITGFPAFARTMPVTHYFSASLGLMVTRMTSPKVCDEMRIFVVVTLRGSF